MEPQEVLVAWHRSDGAVEGLIRWKNLPECEDSWELLRELKGQFPDSYLEDKVVVQWGSVKDRLYGQVYSRRSRRERAEGRE